MQLNKMDMEIAIKGESVIDIFESFDGSYWFVTEKAFKQDSVIDGKVYRNDQIFFGYVRLSSCPECAEFGYFSEAELKQLGSWVWKVPKRNWIVCPEVEIRKISSDRNKFSNKDRDILVSRPAFSRLTEMQKHTLGPKGHKRHFARSANHLRLLFREHRPRIVLRHG